MLEVGDTALAKAGSWRPLTDFFKPLKMSQAHSQQLCRVRLQSAARMAAHGWCPSFRRIRAGAFSLRAVVRRVSALDRAEGAEDWVLRQSKQTNRSKFLFRFPRLISCFDFLSAPRGAPFNRRGRIPGVETLHGARTWRSMIRELCRHIGLLRRHVRALVWVGWLLEILRPDEPQFTGRDCRPLRLHPLRRALAGLALLLVSAPSNATRTRSACSREIKKFVQPATGSRLSTSQTTSAFSTTGEVIMVQYRQSSAGISRLAPSRSAVTTILPARNISTAFSRTLVGLSDWE